MRRAERRGGGEVDDLRDDAAPVDQLTPERRARLRKRKSLNIPFCQRLRVVEIALNGDRLDVGFRAVVICRRCTGDTLRPGKRMATSTRSRPRNASMAAPPYRRRRADDGRPLAVLGEHVVHQAGQELHGHVLEGDVGRGRLQQEMAQADPHGQRHRLVAEPGIGLVDHAAKRAARNFAAGEGRMILSATSGWGDLRDRRSRHCSAAARSPGRRARRPAPGRRARRRGIRVAGLRRG